MHRHYTNAIIIILLACQGKKERCIEESITALTPQHSQTGGEGYVGILGKHERVRVRDESRAFASIRVQITS